MTQKYIVRFCFKSKNSLRKSSFNKVMSLISKTWAYRAKVKVKCFINLYFYSLTFNFNLIEICFLKLIFRIWLFRFKYRSIQSNQAVISHACFKKKSKMYIKIFLTNLGIFWNDFIGSVAGGTLPGGCENPRKSTGSCW